MNDARAQLPSVTALLADPRVAAAIEHHGRERVVEALRLALEAARRGAERGARPEAGAVVDAALQTLSARDHARLRTVINATGVLLHTNLGRAPLSEEAVAAIVATSGPTNLEFDLSTGGRGTRGAVSDHLLASLSGAETAMTVNNGAAALTLVMAALARGQDVVVSRGELVEIGGSFRLPEILTAAGVHLVEVGTTNRTHLADYRAAIHADTGAVLRVHPSNYEVVGFATRPAAREIAAATRAAGVPFVHDIGSGLLRRTGLLTLDGEPTAADAVGAGADIVIFSGDKLLGGPQAGAILGRADLVSACRRHPLARALRVDKLRLAALEVTLEAHARGALQTLPLWSYLQADPDELHERAGRLAKGLDADIVPTDAVVGGGAVPGVTLPSWGVRLGGDAEEIAASLRMSQPAIIGRIVDGDVVLDLRAVPPSEDDTIMAVARTVLGDHQP